MSAIAGTLGVGILGGIAGALLLLLFMKGTVPQGTIIAVTNADCPSGWEKYADAGGRFLLGVADGQAVGQPGALR